MLNTVNTVELEGVLESMDVVKLGGDVYQVVGPNNETIVLEVLAIDLAVKTITIRHNHSVHDLTFKNNLDLVLDKMGIKRAVDNVSTDIKAPMPGKVIDVLVKEGDEVTKGDGILILEAMKMENVLKAEHDCIIKKVLVTTSESVEKNQVLVDLN